MKLAELVRTEPVIRDKHDYFCLSELPGWGVVSSRQLKPSGLDAISLRLATGLVGELDCPAGNRGSKGANEVIIGIGEVGIKKLLDLGGLPCTVCHSGRRLATMAKPIVNKLAENTDSLQNADNNEWLSAHYDARRLVWEKILALKISPARFYTRPNLSREEVNEIAKLFQDAGLPVPSTGYYETTSANHFTPYSF